MYVGFIHIIIDLLLNVGKYFSFMEHLGCDAYLGKIPILTNIFQRGWFNHQLGMNAYMYKLCPAYTLSDSPYFSKGILARTQTIYIYVQHILLLVAQADDSLGLVTQMKTLRETCFS